MNKVLFAFLIVSCFVTMQRYGIARTFAWIYLPAVLLVNFATAMQLPGIPNLSTPTAIGYGVLAGILFRWKDLKTIRWNLLDWMMLLMLIPTFLSTLSVIDLWHAYRDTSDMFFVWIIPYFMARKTLQEAEGRKLMLKTLCYCAILVGFLALLEARLKPNFTARILSKLQWDDTANDMVMKRFGLMRAIATAGQPIDLGNCGLLVGTMILILVPATGSSFKQKLPLAGLLGAGAMVVGCVSFTAWFGMAMAFGFFLLLSTPGLGRLLVVPLLMVEIVGMVGVSHKLMVAPITEDRPDDDLEASTWIRERIMQDAWDQAATSGWFGYGTSLDTRHIGVGSVDNSYLLFIMRTGWFSFGMWVALAFLVTGMGSVMLGRAKTASERRPVAAGLAGFLAILVAMYTVFFGFAYAILFCMLLGMIGSMYQLFSRPSAQAQISGSMGAPPYALAGGGYR